jgi:hypothetical protein
MKKMTMAFLAGILLTCGFFTTASHLDFNKSARGDIPNKIATMKYTPLFHEWAQVWLKSEIEYGRPGCIISVYLDQTRRGIRWRIESFRSRSESSAEKRLYDKVYRDRQSLIQQQVTYWRKRGYDVSFSDFTFEKKWTR